MIVLVKGNDAIVRDDEVRGHIARAVGDGERSLVLEELTEKAYWRGEQDPGGFDIARLVDGAQTPPFLSEHRVVVGRHLGRFTTKDSVAALVDYLADPLETTRLILVWEAGVDPKQDRLGPVPKSLLSAITEAGGEIVDAKVPGGRGGSKWLDAQLAKSSLRLDATARQAVGDRLGEDRSRVLALIEVLEATFGVGATLSVDDVTPYLGRRGQLPPWDLTDAIDNGDIPLALDVLHRMMGAGDRHPFQILATLHTHYGRMLRLDGADVADENAAARLLDMKGSSYPAKKALTQTRLLGSEKVATAIGLLADADVDMRGVKEWDDELAMEVLVARLAAQARRGDRPSGR